MSGGFLFDAEVMKDRGRYGVAARASDMHASIIAPFLAIFGTEKQKRQW